MKTPSPCFCLLSRLIQNIFFKKKQFFFKFLNFFLKISKKMIFFNFWKNQKLEKFWNLFSCFSCFLLFSYLKNDRKFFIIFELFAQISRL